ncbi:hypothetical protein BB560_004855 [Smittium megazygosporum]|uniref:RING-type E3 ubiquitin transferase n=1 Tax=Smittium megazygosporum TaxID=133381 RepID=A0A2T9Z823_9FUNG|nr:hypothetical protein BB560_004855 [Smittium megazygosporum]
MEYLNPVDESTSPNARAHRQPTENSCSEPPSTRSQTVALPNDVGSRAASETRSPSKKAPVPHIRIAPHIVDVRHCLYFDVIDREVPENFLIKVGRFTDKVSNQQSRIAFKSKVVSRSHAEIWTENGNFFIRDTKSSSGTFLNHMRLSPPGIESAPFPLKDGDILQLGVDYQGGTLEIYKCVKIRVEINRKWQRTKGNNFRKQILKNIQDSYAAIGNTDDGKQDNECCICLYNMLAFQSLFVAPCSHCFHFKCVKQLLFTSSGFNCPLCRTYADLEASISEDEEMDDSIEDGISDPEIPSSSNLTNLENSSVRLVDNKVAEITSHLPIAVQIVQNQMSQNLAELSRISDNQDTESNIPDMSNPVQFTPEYHLTDALGIRNQNNNYDSTNASEDGDHHTNVSENEDILRDAIRPTPIRQATVVSLSGNNTPISTVNQISQPPNSTPSDNTSILPTDTNISLLNENNNISAAPISNTTSSISDSLLDHPNQQTPAQNSL